MQKISDIPLALSYDDVLLVPQSSRLNSRSEVNLATQITPHVKLNLPLISINMTDVTGVRMAIAMGKLGGMGFLPRFVSPETQAEWVNQVKREGVKVGAAIGIRDGEFERAEKLYQAGADIISIDVAHGAMEKVLRISKKLRAKFGSKVGLIPGVIATYEAASDLYKAGADSVRVGVGPGTICITRVVTGIGVPQITAIMDVARAAKKWRKTVIGDGGTKNTGDVMKGLAAGASAILIGGQFAGCEETPGKLLLINGVKYKVYNASTCETEKKAHLKQIKNLSKTYINHIEGVESRVIYKGSIFDLMPQFEANLRAGYSYCGARNIKELWAKAGFVRVSPMGTMENGLRNALPQQNTP